MKTRDYKQFAIGEHYHVYNRGVGKIDIFKDEEDYSNFIKRLKLVLGEAELPSKGRSIQIKPLAKGAFSLVSFCLMPNHYHFLIRQNSEISITKLIAKVCTSYAMYFNKKYNRVGTLFQDAFKSINIDGNSYLLWLSAYIHQNPATAGLVWDLRKWKWSSYPEYVELTAGEFCQKEIILGQYIKNSGTYQKFVETSFDEIRRKAELEPFLLDGTP